MSYVVKVRRTARYSALYRKVALEFSERVIRELDGEIQAVVLYGSVARGLATRQSDMDLFVVTPHPKQVGDRIGDIQLDLSAQNPYWARFSAFPMTVDDIRRLVSISSPYLRDVVNEGIVLYDDGMFTTVRAEVLGAGPYWRYMTEEHPPEVARTELARAERMLADAWLLLQNRALESAADRAYYAMFHAAIAALSQEVPRLPESHDGLQMLFTMHFVRTNRVPQDLAGDLGRAFRLRQDSTYGGDEGRRDAELDEPKAAELVDKAEAFVAAMRRLLGMEERP